MKNNLDSFTLERFSENALTLNLLRKHLLQLAVTGALHPVDDWDEGMLEELSSQPIIDGDWIESKDQDPNGNIRLLQLADIGEGFFKDKSQRFVNHDTFIRLKCTPLEKDDVLIARLPDPIGRACLFPELDQKCITVVDVAIVKAKKNVILPEYLVMLMNSPAMNLKVIEQSAGTTRQRVATGKLKKMTFIFPSKLENQQNIIDKYKALEAIVERLELQSNKKEEIATSARNSAVASLSTSQSTEEFQEAWNQIQLNWEMFTGSSESIETLRNLILSLAISGNLTRGFNSQDSVEELLDNVSKKMNPYPEMSEERFALPKHWKWVPLASVAEHQLGKMLHTAKMRGTRRKYLRSVNVRQDGFIDLTDLNEMLIPDSELEKYSVIRGDLFVNEGGDVGRNAIFDVDIDFDLAFQNQLHRLRPVCGIQIRYIQFVLRQAKSQGILARMSSGVTIQHFSATALRRFAVPLPPLSEQKLIVEIVNQLMTLCDELEQGLLEAENISEKFSRSVVSASA